MKGYTNDPLKYVSHKNKSVEDDDSDEYGVTTSMKARNDIGNDIFELRKQIMEMKHIWGKVVSDLSKIQDMLKVKEKT